MISRTRIATLPSILFAAAALVTVLAGACRDGDGPTAPEPGTISVSVETSGGDLDIDGYEFVVDSVTRRSLSARTATVGADGTQRADAVVAGVTAGAHSATLEGVADNCTVSGPSSRSITLTPGQVVNVAFTVVCAATGIEITTRTTGPDFPSNYDLLVDRSSIRAATNGTQIVSRLEPGAHAVSLHTRGANCSVAGDTLTTVAVTARTITPVRFDVTCLPVVRLEKIAYVVDTLVNGKADRWIVLVNPDGSGAKTFAIGGAPAWSPNGTTLAYSTTVCNPADDYYSAPTCFGGLVVTDPETSNVLTLADGSRGFNPAWAPTGDVIAFTRCCESGDVTRLYLARVDGSPVVPLNIPFVDVVRDPTWSPDGRRIAFTCFLDNESADVCLINRDGSGFVRLTKDGATKGDPAWSPDGSRIAFTKITAGSPPEIALVASDGGGVTRLTDGFEAAWSRDGTTLIFAGGDGLYTINVDGSHRTRLTTGGQTAPALRP